MSFRTLISALRVVLGRISMPLSRLGASIEGIRAGRRDGTDRRERHSMLRALQSIEAGVMIVDQEGRVVMQNPQARRCFGPIDTGVAVRDALRDRAPTLIAAFDRVASVGEVVQAQSPAGELDLRVRIDPILDEDGRPLGRVFVATDMSEELRQKQRADFLATHDSLTGLSNGRALEAKLDDLVGRHGDVAILLGDLDRFKKINETLGHAVGDALLKHVGSILRAIVTDGDMPVRLGGDEFAIVAAGPKSSERLEEYSTKLIQSLSGPQNVDGQPLQTGISIGIASGPPPNGMAAELIQMADLALYEAKTAGRGRSSRFHTELLRSAHRRKWLEDNLRLALAAEDQLAPVFQAQTDLRTRRIVGFEALARWTHPIEGPISPVEFIPVAEEAGLIQPLTARILHESLAVAKEICAPAGPRRIAVNVSPQLFDGRIAEMICDALMQCDAPADCLEIEITEQVVLMRGDAARREIERIRALGVTVALDDFGMGYSSLSYLHNFPVDKIKIDRAFVAEIAQSSQTRAIVRAIVELGHALGMTVAGEGAETEAERSGLFECGADTVQGWVDGRPMSASDVRALVRADSKARKKCAGS